MARDCASPIRLVSLLIVSVLIASAIPALSPTVRDAPRTAEVMQTADTGAIRVCVTDDVGRPIAGVEVSVVGDNVSETLDTNLTGYVLFDYLPTDLNWTQYSIFASKDGYNPSGVVEVDVSPWNTSDETLVIFGGVIYGVVEDALGPISEAVASIPTLGYSNTTDAYGAYFIRGVPGGTPYSVTVTALGYVNQTKAVTLDTAGIEILNFLMVSLSGAVSGTVWHAATEDALFNVSVSVRVGTVTVTVTSEADGSYRIPDLPSGTYTVSAQMEGFEPASISGVIVVSGSDTTEVDFMLQEKPTKLYGVVRAGTFLVPGVLVTVVGTGLFTNTSLEGEYTITNITAGTYDVVASLEGYTPITVAGVIIPRGGEVQLNINMESIPGSSLSGLVLSSDSRSPLSGVEVVIIGLAVQRGTVTNVYGQFEITGLSGGNYTIRFSLDGYQPKEISPVSVPPEGAAPSMQVQLEPLSETLGGFIFGFDLAHSMMILALFLTIIILALAVMLRIKTFEAPDKAPAVYDQDEPSEGEDAARGKEPLSEKERKKKEKRRR